MSADDDPGSSKDSFLKRIADAPAISPPLPLPQPGERMGRFEILERLGSGATGVVLGARDVVLGRPVAIKLLAIGALAESAKQHLLSEARATARIEHPGVAVVHDVLEISGTLAIVMEHVPGETLRRLLRRGAMSERDAVSLACQAARAAAAAHRARIVHRDLKPENMIVTRDGRVKLLDFGLAAVLEGGSSEGPAGTPGYLAPEARDGRATAASDQFALAVVLVEALTGARPTSSADLPRGLSRRLRPIVARALSARAEQRFSSCDEFADHLEGRPSSASRAFAWRAALGLGLIAIVVRGGTTSTTDSAREPSASRQPTAAVPALVACPQLATPDPRLSWLGAAAANIACRNARALLGGARERATPPAQLLGLPRAPSPDFPRDPFSGPGARARSLAAAEESGRVIIDGSVVREGDAFRVALTALWDGTILSEGTGRGTLARATSEATAQLFDDGALHRARAVDEEAALITGSTSIATLQGLAIADAASSTGGSLAWAREALLGSLRESPLAMVLDNQLAAGLGDAPPAIAPAIDSSSPLALARTAPAHVLLGGESPAAALAERIAALRGAGRSDSEALELLRSESLLRLFADQNDRARTLALAAALQDPWDAPWGVIAHASLGRPEFATFSRAYCAWEPEVADAWNIAAYADTPESERLPVFERAYRLGESFPLYAGNYGAWLVIAHRLDEARVVMAELEVGTAGQRIAARKLGVEIALSEGRVAGAYDQAWSALSELRSVASIETGDVALLGLFVELGVLLGRSNEAGRRVFETFLLADPPRVDRGPFAQAAMAHACAYAERALADRCFARLQDLTERGYFPHGDTGDSGAFVEGARAFAAGDRRAAASAFRRVRASLGGHASVAALAFEDVGDLDRADAVDPPRPGVIGGISLSHARSARRAMARGDCSRAVPLARGVEQALRTADTELAAATQMRSIIARCCQKSIGCRESAG